MIWGYGYLYSGIKQGRDIFFRATRMQRMRFNYEKLQVHVDTDTRTGVLRRRCYEMCRWMHVCSLATDPVHEQRSFRSAGVWRVQ